MYTVVTGLFDIGRGNWKHYQRPKNAYLVYLKNVASLNAPMIIFCEQHDVAFIFSIRRNIPHSTKIVSTRIEDLYMNKYKDLLLDIQKDPKYGKHHPNPVCPEIAVPMYSYVVTSKPDLLYRGSLLADTDYCIWLDGGYTHGSIDISKIHWDPTSILAQKDKISIISLRPLSDMISDDPKAFSDQYIDIINGGFFGGTKKTIASMHEKYYAIVHEMLTVHRMKEDDQFYWTFFAKRYPELINLIPGTWYSAFEIK